MKSFILLLGTNAYTTYMSPLILYDIRISMVPHTFGKVIQPFNGQQLNRPRCDAFYQKKNICANYITFQIVINKNFLLCLARKKIKSSVFRIDWVSWSTKHIHKFK